MPTPSVKIYTTPVCVYCKMAKSFFAENDVKYEEVNVASDTKAREEMIAKSRQIGVPVIDIGGKIIIGFDKPRIAEALGIK
ncbi:MAG: glutaredoxin family protein [Candidatus Sungbacteria bacterium]|uniref:Glutaredoxin family protein n=1 Tax=Candidatus Sungiibacteriota bacterium TaxID=2750080 RepID=A0A9D6LUF5_9BACT|nr:glutaredoxin family protein [Candidatus Sungbacteria bacterium]